MDAVRQSHRREIPLGRSAIQVAFTIFVLIETWLVPVEGYLVDRFGPKWVVLGGGILVAIAWVMNSAASSLPALYFAAAVGGIGTGWFTAPASEMRSSGSPAGAVSRGNHRIGFWRRRGGHDRTDIAHDRFVRLRACVPVLRLLQGAIVFVISWMLLAPPPALIAARVKPSQTSHGYTPLEVLKSPVFYLMYLMFVLIAAGGLTMAASMAPIAKDFRSTSCRSLCSG